jgi:hypothetical protein
LLNGMKAGSVCGCNVRVGKDDAPWKPRDANRWRPTNLNTRVCGGGSGGGGGGSETEANGEVTLRHQGRDRRGRYSVCEPEI